MHDTLTIVQAALLIAGENPAEHQDFILQNDEINRPDDFTAYFSALTNAIEFDKIEATLKFYGNGDSDEIDWEKSLIEVDKLKIWLSGNGVKPAFFFDNDDKEKPNYFDKNHECYAPKLVAAIRAWEAVSTEQKYKDNGKTVKKNLESWLTAHAEDFGLLKDDGEINNDAIVNQVSKVSNWNDKGGASKTPER